MTHKHQPSTTHNVPEGAEVVPMNQFRVEWHGHMTPDGYEAGTDYRCNYCDKLCYYGERLQHTCDAYDEWLLRNFRSADKSQQLGLVTGEHEASRELAL